MSSIDLVILGMAIERPLSAYDIQKDIEYHHFRRWTRISIPSVYKKVLQLKDKGYLKSESVKGNRFAEKAVYSVTEKGRAYFERLMDECASAEVALQFDFNVVITNLSRLETPRALILVEKLRKSITKSREKNALYKELYSSIPFAGRAIFEQQELLYASLLDWLDSFGAGLADGG